MKYLHLAVAIACALAAIGSLVLFFIAIDHELFLTAFMDVGLAAFNGLLAGINYASYRSLRDE